MKNAVGVFSMLFASACCSSLPNAPLKQVTALAVTPADHGVQESSAVWRDERRSREVPVHLYVPSGSGTRWPVVVFSHGIGEDRDSYAYVGRALAQNGFLAVHITHAGTDKAVLRRGYWKLYRATKDPENWRNRPLDVSFVIDRIAARPDVDMSRIAVAGHSAGAFTAFAVAGVHGPNGEGMRDDRVRVIVAMSMPKIEGFSYDDARVPALNITGTCDSSLIYRTRPRDRRVPFDQTHAAHQYLVTIDRVDHNTFSSATDPHHELIMRMTIAFLRAWLLDDAQARAWFDDAGRVTIGKETMVVERK
jgi:pimeloyl-ACP methyl ester carboxylesterase